VAITEETLRLARDLRIRIDAIVDERTRALVKAWAEAWDAISGEMLAAVDALIAAAVDGRWPPRSIVLRNERATRALALVLAHLETLAREAGIAITADVTAAATTAAAAQPAVIASQLPPAAVAATVAPVAAAPGELAAMVARATQQITALTWPLSAEAYQSVVSSLIAGVALGDNPRTTARKMVRRVEGRFNRGLSRALVIARTETLDASREATRLAHQANAEALAGWQWQATLDRDTCPSCWAMHGRLYPLDAPGPLDHQQGRCARLPKARSWRELGFDLDEPEDLLPDARVVFDALPEADQLAVMGPARLAALRDGTASWEDLARRRTTTGWRDSYAPTPVRDLAS
jgi:SPP1 gp7 family putative phage head morphogenesis protein